MASYVDGFVVVVQKKKLAAYRKLSVAASKIWKRHGALEYRECVGDDLGIPMGIPFPKLCRLKPGETVVFAWIRYKSRAQRDRINKLVMSDPTLAALCDEKSVPFDMKRMSMGGFATIVEA